MINQTNCSEATCRIDTSNMKRDEIEGIIQALKNLDRLKEKKEDFWWYDTTYGEDTDSQGNCILIEGQIPYNCGAQLDKYLKDTCKIDDDVITLFDEGEYDQQELEQNVWL